MLLPVFIIENITEIYCCSVSAVSPQLTQPGVRSDILCFSLWDRWGLVTLKTLVKGYIPSRGRGQAKGLYWGRGVEEEKQSVGKQKVVACNRKHPQAQCFPKGARPPLIGEETSSRGRPFTEECVFCVHQALQPLCVCTSASKKERTGEKTA